ncbi:hypothetical protein GW931_01995 [archaeon]|nr:hypothetical protein [archaeon]
MKEIIIKGAREHNLKNISLTLPKEKFIVLTGLSGSGKSTLAFDALYAEGQRRDVESLSSYARQFIGMMDKPDVDSIEGLSPAISIEQKTTSKNPRSTVGTVTEVYDYLRLLYARIGVPYCPEHNEPILSQTPEEISKKIQRKFKEENNITPKTIIKPIKEKVVEVSDVDHIPKKEIPNLLIELEKDMKLCAEKLDFENVIRIKNKIKNLQKRLNKN